MLKFTLLWLIAILISFAALAQSTQKRGYVVLNDHDTLSGWINYKSWRGNPSEIVFRKDSAAAVSTTYRIADLSYFEITGLDAYVKAAVTLDMRPVAGDRSG